MSSLGNLKSLINTGRFSYMKTEAENRKLFQEARELRANIKECLHDRAKNINSHFGRSCSSVLLNEKTHNKLIQRDFQSGHDFCCRKKSRQL